MSTFVSRTFAAGNDIALQLGGEEWVRQLSMGNNWNYLRIGVLMAINPIGGTNLPAGGPTIGVCSGTTNPYGAAATANFVGYGFCFGGAASFAANSGQSYFACNGWNNVVSRVGTTTTSSYLGGGYNVGIPCQGVGVQRKWMIFVDIQKGSPNYMVKIHSILENGSGTIPGDATVADLLSGMPQSPTIVVGGVNLGNHSNVIAASEAPGVLDTVNICYSQAGYPLEIYEVAAQKLA